MKENGKKIFAIFLSVAMVFSAMALCPVPFVKQVSANSNGNIIYCEDDGITFLGTYDEENLKNLASEKGQVVINETSLEYTGKAITVDISVIYDEEELTEDTDYKVTYENNINAGEAKVVIEGIGAYTGTVENTFTISPVDISSDKVVVDDSNLKEDLEFNGKDRTPILKFTYNGVLLNINADFLAEYKNNFYPGTATVTVTGIGNYTGTLTKTFNIVKKPIGNVTIRTGFDANKQLVITVNNGSYPMGKGVDYIYNVSTDAEGKITITFTGMGSHYSGTFVKVIEAKDNPNSPQNITVTEKPQTTTAAKKIPVKRAVIKSVKNAKGKKIKILWKKLSGVSGYNIRYSVNKNFKKAKTKLIKKKNIRKYTIKKLKMKKYYVQIRAYKISGGKKSFGEWSKRKSVKIKK